MNSIKMRGYFTPVLFTPKSLHFLQQFFLHNKFFTSIFCCFTPILFYTEILHQFLSIRFFTPIFMYTIFLHQNFEFFTPIFIFINFLHQF